jgi:uncharacterized NAD-dependent epimerase/dehydratase family protein
MSSDGIVLTGGLYHTINAKTAHGLVRGPSRFRLRAVIDAAAAGADAGRLLDGVDRGIPVVESVQAALALGEVRVCIVGVANAGGVLPAELRPALVDAARAGLTLVSGLHHLLADDAEITAAVRAGGGAIIDIRRPRPTRELRFWSGECLAVKTPRIAVIGTDCAIGKRTTAQRLVAECEARGIRAEMIYTGQTGWLQGGRHGFILDATPNDFVAGELERAIVNCAREQAPDLMLLEGQSALRNPSGPCGAELLVSAGARGVILQHAPGRPCFEGLAAQGCRVPPIKQEIELIRLYGAEVLAVTVSEVGLDAAGAKRACRDIEVECGVPAVLPLRDLGPAVDAMLDFHQREAAA